MKMYKSIVKSIRLSIDNECSIVAIRCNSENATFLNRAGFKRKNGFMVSDIKNAKRVMDIISVNMSATIGSIINAVGALEASGASIADARDGKKK